MNEKIKKQCDILFDQIQAGNNNKASFELGVLEAMIMIQDGKASYQSDKTGEVMIEPVKGNYYLCADAVVYLKTDYECYCEHYKSDDDDGKLFVEVPCE